MDLSESIKQRYRTDQIADRITKGITHARRKRVCGKRKSQSRNDVSRQTRCKTK
ncbi:hypothetical protein ACR2Q7_001757 [Staphylococcus pseudintermedius]